MPDLATVVAAFERRFSTVSAGYPAAVNQHNEPYVSLCSGGLKSEDGLVPAMFAEELDAIDAWAEAAEVYATKHWGPHLYWRTCPALVKEAKGSRHEGYHWVYSRLVLSKKAPDWKPPMPSFRMPSYACHKVVQAAPILYVDQAAGYVAFHLPPSPTREKFIQPVPAEFFGRGIPRAGDYLLRYGDGYLSWSPKRAFEGGYTAITDEVAAAVRDGLVTYDPIGGVTFNNVQPLASMWVDGGAMKLNKQGLQYGEAEAPDASYAARAERAGGQGVAPGLTPTLDRGE